MFVVYCYYYDYFYASQATGKVWNEVLHKLPWFRFLSAFCEMYPISPSRVAPWWHCPLWGPGSSLCCGCVCGVCIFSFCCHGISPSCPGPVGAHVRVPCCGLTPHPALLPALCPKAADPTSQQRTNRYGKQIDGIIFGFWYGKQMGGIIFGFWYLWNGKKLTTQSMKFKRFPSGSSSGPFHKIWAIDIYNW